MIFLTLVFLGLFAWVDFLRRLAFFPTVWRAFSAVTQASSGAIPQSRGMTVLLSEFEAIEATETM